MSKGSKQRPTDKDKFDANFDRIFGDKTREFVTDIMTNSSNISGIRVTHLPSKIYVTAFGDKALIKSARTRSELMDKLKEKIGAYNENS